MLATQKSAERHIVLPADERREATGRSVEHLEIRPIAHPPEFRQPVEALAAALPNARTALVGGGHLIDPAAPEVLAFIEEVLGQP